MTAPTLFDPPAKVKPLSKRQRLMLLLGDGEWHHIQQMIKFGGTRFGGRLREMRLRGFDHEVRTDSEGATWSRWNKP